MPDPTYVAPPTQTDLQTNADNGVPAWDPEAKQARVLANPQQLEQAFLSGKLQLVRDHQYVMVAPNGKIYNAPASSVEDALKHGYHLGTAYDAAKAEAGTVTGQLRTLVDGAVDAATLGFGDAAQASMGVDKLGLKARAEVNPGTRIIGVIGGTALAAAATDGVSLAGGAEALAARAIGTEAAATTLGRMGVTAVGGAVEGAVVGTGQAVGESVVNDTPLAAESLLAAGATGAFWGGAGAALIGTALGHKPAGTEHLRPTPDDIERAMSRQLGERAPAGYGQKLLDVFDNLNHKFDQIGAQGLEAQGNKDLAEVLRGSPASKKRFFKQANTPRAEIEADTRKLKDLLEHRLAGYGKFVDAAHLEEQVAAARRDVLKADADYRRAKLDLGPIDALGATLTPGEADAVNHARGVLEEAKSKLADARALQSQFDHVEEFVTQVRRDFGVDSKGRVNESKLAAFVNSITKPQSDERLAGLKALAGDDLKLNNMLDVVSERHAAINLVNDQLMREKLAGMDVGLQAGVLGHAVGGFPAALAAREAVGNLTRPLHAAMGRMALAAQADRVVQHIGTAVEKWVLKTQEAGLAVQLHRKLVPTTMLMLHGTRQQRRDATQERIAELQVDTTVKADRLSSATEHLDAIAPDISAVMRDRLAQAHMILEQVTPRPLAPGGVTGALLPNPTKTANMIPDRDIKRFAEVDATIQDPLRLVDQLADGHNPDPAAVLAFKTAYPALWQQVTQTVLDTVSQHPDKVDWNHVKTIVLSLNLDAHPAFASGALALRQQLIKAQPNQAQPVTKSLQAAHNKELAGAAATLNDRLTERPTRR